MAGLILGDDAASYNKTIDRIIELKSFRLHNLQTNQIQNDIRFKSMTLLKEQLELLKKLTRELYLNLGSKTLNLETDQNYLVGSVSNQAVPGDYELEIVDLAKSGVIASEPHIVDPHLPSGDFVFKIDEEELSFSFEGGTPKELASLINGEADEYFNATWVKKNYKEWIFVLASKKPGRRNRFYLIEDHNQIFQALNLYKTANLEGYKGKQLHEDNVMELPQEYVSTNIPYQTKVDFSEVDQLLVTVPAYNFEKLELQFSDKKKTAVIDLLEIKKSVLGEEAYLRSKKSENPVSTTFGLGLKSFDYAKEIFIEQLHFAIDLRPADVIEKEKAQKAWEVTNKQTAITNVNLSKSNQLIAPLQEKSKTELTYLTSITTNSQENNTLDTKTVATLTNIVINFPGIKYDLNVPPEAALVPVNQVQEERDAVLLFQSIELERDENVVTDLIEGVSLKLVKPTKEPTRIRISKNVENIYQRVQKFINQYNLTMQYINIFQANDLDALGVDELEGNLEEKVGSLKNEFWLTRIKDQIRNLLLKDYFIDYETGTMLMIQLGMENNYTFARPNDINSDTINFNESIFRSTILNYEQPERVFSQDKDGNQQLDSGYAWELDRLINVVVGANSFMGLYLQSRKDEKRRNDDRIAREEEVLKKERAKMEEEFGKIEQVKKQQKQIEGMLQNFNTK